MSTSLHIRKRKSLPPHQEPMARQPKMVVHGVAGFGTRDERAGL